MAHNERSATAALVAHLCEMDRRGLHRDQGYSSLFDYCVRVLRLSESAAYLRIHAARLARRYPEVLPRLARGELHLSALKRLGPKLTDENHQALLQAAAGKCKSELEVLLAEHFPAADADTVIRKLPEPAPTRAAEPLSLLPPPPAAEQAQPLAAAPAPAPPRASASPHRPAPPPLTPLSPQRFKVQFTASRALHDKLQTARRLTRHRHRDGDIAAVVEQALELLIEREMKRQFAQTSRPRARRSSPKPGSRHIPADVRREVARRDGMRCSFVSADGHRCQARQRLQYHHERAFALGGEASTDNIRLLCQSHNLLMAEREFGPLFMQRARSSPQPRPATDSDSVQNEFQA